MKLDHQKHARLVTRLAMLDASARGISREIRDERESLTQAVSPLTGNRALAKHWQQPEPVANILKLPADVLKGAGVDARAVQSIVDAQARVAAMQADADARGAERAALARVVENCNHYVKAYAA